MAFYVRGNPSLTNNINAKDMAITLLAALPARNSSGAFVSGKYLRTPTDKKEITLCEVYDGPATDPRKTTYHIYNHSMLQWHMAGWTSVINTQTWYSGT